MDRRNTCLMMLLASICFFLVMGALFTGIGSFCLNSADAKSFREAQCTIVASSSGSSSKKDRSGSQLCEFQVNTSLTGGQIFEESEYCGGNELPCDRCAIYSSFVGKCWVVYEEGEATYVSTLADEVTDTLLGLFLTTLGAMSFALCCMSCFCVRVTCIATKSMETPLQGIPPQQIGQPFQGKRSYEASDKVSRLRETVKQFTSTFGWVVSGFAFMAIIAGIYLGMILLYFHNRKLEIADKELPATASLAGFGASGLFLLLVPVFWGLLFLGQCRANQLLDKLAENSDSQGELQKQMSQILIENLRSKRGQRYRNWLYDAGIGEVAVERILTAPPDQMMDTLMDQLSGLVCAKVTTMIFEEFVTPPFEDMMFLFSVSFLGVPGALVLLLLFLARYCIKFEVDTASCIISFLGMLVLIFLRLRCTLCYVLSFIALNILIFGTLVIAWAKHGVTNLSVLSFLLCFPAFCVWLTCCVIFICSLKPLAEALFEVFKEVNIIMIWKSCDCERNPEELHEKEKAVIKASGCFGRIFGVEGTLQELANAVRPTE